MLSGLSFSAARRSAHALLALLLVAATLFLLGGANANAAAIEALPGCSDSLLPPGEDASSNAVLGFDVNFFGATWSDVWVNENGNVTFGGPFDFYPGFDLTLAETGFEIIAPLHANGTRDTGGLVTYGQTTYAGRAAFCVNWLDLTPSFFFGEEPARAPANSLDNHEGEPHNSFQLLLVDRSDVAAGDFDVIFNYDEVQWDGSYPDEGEFGLGGVTPLNIFGEYEVPGRAGYSDGNPFTPSTSFELPGSGEVGGFIDSNLVTGLINNSYNSLTLGRYLFNLRGGSAPAGSSILGDVTAAVDGSPIVGAPVTVCLPTGAPCVLTTTGPLGGYEVAGLPDGDYSVSVFAPPLSSLLPQTVSPVTIAGSDEVVDFALAGPTPPPSGTTIEPSRGDGAVPVIYWQDEVTVTTTGCPGGTATLEVIQGASVFASVPMVEGPLGTYTGTFGPLFPDHDEATVVVTIDCDPDPEEVIGFDIYIDPSGTVFESVSGDPLEGATTTLYRADSAIGPFTPVPDGSAVMSPANRTNPDLTGPDGLFGWDVIAGYYFVRAEAPGCVDPDDAGIPFVDTAILEVEPEWLGLEMFLECNPVLDLPADITVPATSPTGAPVTFSATATDAVEGPVPVTCLPASGDVFPVGTTTVACSAADSFGNTSTGEFDVTVEIVEEGIRPTIQEVRDLLAGLVPGDKHLDKAVERLDDALDDDLWLNDDQLTDHGKKAFQALYKAAKELGKVDEPHTAVATAQAEVLADQAELLALGALADAAGGDPHDLAKALEEMEKAAEDRAAGRHDKAIKHYRRAWEKARKALG